jgi:CheY-like chemotaxis protein
MTQPLALIFYERLLPGTQLVNLLQDLGYRVQTVTDTADLAGAVVEHQPMLLLADLQSTRLDVIASISRICSSRETEHLPVVAFTAEESPEGHAAARQAGATLVVQDQALLSHLPQLLEQALRIE